MNTKHNNERRQHERFAIACEMAIRINDDFYQCSIINLSRGGILADIMGAVTSDIFSGDIGTCFLDYCDEAFESKCQIIRIVDRKIGLAFVNLGIREILFLNKLITTCR